MDIIHHTLIGGAGYSIAAELNEPIAGIAFLIGSIFPDLDVIFMLLGKRFYLKNHQGVTHSLILAPFFSLLLCLPILWLLDIGLSWPVYIGLLAGLVLHIVLDWLNTFRISLFYPFNKNRYSLDAVFFIDGFLLIITLLFYLLYHYLEIKVTAYIYPVIFTIYCIAKIYLHNHVVAKLNALYAIPSSINPFEFYILHKHENKLFGYIYNAATGNKRSTTQYNNTSDETYQLVNKSNIYKEIDGITRELAITNIIKTDKKTIITAQDIAVRNFGGKFAKTVIEFDNDGNILSEVVNI